MQAPGFGRWMHRAGGDAPDGALDEDDAAEGGAGRGLHSFALELNLSNSRTRS